MRTPAELSRYFPPPENLNPVGGNNTVRQMKRTAAFLGALAICAFFVGCVSMDDVVMAMSSGSPSLQDLGPLAKVEVAVWEANGGTSYVSSDPEYLGGLARVARKFPDEYIATPPINLGGERIEARVFAQSGESRWMCVQSGSLILEDGFYSGSHAELVRQLSAYLSSIKSVPGVRIEPAKEKTAEPRGLCSTCHQYQCRGECPLFNHRQPFGMAHLSRWPKE